MGERSLARGGFLCRHHPAPGCLGRVQSGGRPDNGRRPLAESSECGAGVGGPKRRGTVNYWKVRLATVVIFGTGVLTGGVLVNFVDHSHPKTSHRQTLSTTNSAAQ